MFVILDTVKACSTAHAAPSAGLSLTALHRRGTALIMDESVVGICISIMAVRHCLQPCVARLAETLGTGVTGCHCSCVLRILQAKPYTSLGL